MASTIDKIKKDIIEAINASQRTTTPYDTEAEIVRVDGNVAWVHIPGGATETPVALTINARKGDKVQVRVSNGGAWLMGNATAPPTDDAKANEAEEKAAEAKYLAVDAADAALRADIAAQDAVVSAEIAGQAAHDAQVIAENVEGIAKGAQENAVLAYNSATAAQWQLAAVEDVVGTLEWIATHAIYKWTDDTTVELGKWYYTLTATAVQSADLKVFDLQSGRYYLQMSEYRYSAVEEPDVSDIATYYEYDPETGTYSLTEDVSIDEEKTYYTRSSFIYYVAATGSVIDPLATYYTVVAVAASPSPTVNPHELGYYEIDSYDKTVQNYISTHLSLDEGGLHLTDGNINNRVDISTAEGVVIWNAGKKIAQYGSDTIIGDEKGYYIKISPTRLSFLKYTDPTHDPIEIAFMSGEELSIPRVVVVDSLKIGYWMWDGNMNPYHLTLRWIGG